MHVAVVDDEEAVRRALARLLRAAGVETSTFSSGAEFLEALGPFDPDCLIIDLQMDGMDGFEVQERLEAMGSALPVILLTGCDSPAARARANSSGVSLYLTKPVDLDELLDAIGGAAAERLREA